MEFKIQANDLMMPERAKILLLDDDPAILDIYTELFQQLPSQPEIKTTTSGARAIALLEAEPFSLLISDLKMPRMDGLQVLAIVRRKFPQLRTVVLTSLTDEQFRMRAYAMGLDLYLEKPNSTQGTQLVLDCIESLLGQNLQSGGFRGMQRKSLVDIIQLECLCQSSSVLKVINGPSEGRIWFDNGQIIDAVTGDLNGESAFQRILAWKTGNFELLPAEPDHPVTITSSYQNLLLASVQAIDEAQAAAAPPAPAADVVASDTPLIRSAQIQGVEFVLQTAPSASSPPEVWAVEDAASLKTWTQTTLTQFSALGEHLQAGPLSEWIGLGLHHHVALATHGDQMLCLGLNRSLSVAGIHDTLNITLAQWGS